MDENASYGFNIWKITLQMQLDYVKMQSLYMEVKFLIVYNKLGDYLKSQNKRWIDLQRELNLSPSMTAKFTKNRIVSTDTINKVCEYLQVQPSEIMEWIPDAEYNKANEEKQAIEAQIAELQAKLKTM